MILVHPSPSFYSYASITLQFYAFYALSNNGISHVLLYLSIKVYYLASIPKGMESIKAEGETGGIFYDNDNCRIGSFDRCDVSVLSVKDKTDANGKRAEY